MNYLEIFLGFYFAASGCVWISVFTSLVGVPAASESSAVGLRIYATTTGIKEYKSIIKKKNKEHDNTVFLEKTQLNAIEFWTSKALIYSNINHDKIVSVNNVLREYNEMKEKIKILKMQYGLWNILFKNDGNVLCQL